MSEVGQKEALTQRRVVKLLRETLGYRYLGYWEDRAENSNVEEEQLRAWLTRRGHDDATIGKVLRELDQARAVHGTRNLYDANRDVYSLLRYGVKVRPEPGAPTETIWLVDWENPSKNDFGFAEEVTIAGEHEKRPDIVLYLNGIAVGVLELKRSVISVAEGIRQNLGNQTKTFIRPFFATVQLVMAGNDTEGLRYGVIETPEKYYLTWKETSDVKNPLDRALSQICRQERLLELIHDFVVFDAGTKKICRPNQYFGVRAAQERVRQREGGIIWHTQGSGKTLTMVWLAKWLRENIPDSRVLLITDRTELDEQSEKVFLGVDEKIRRTKSGADLLAVLARDEDWLVCSLVHKFGAAEEGDVDAYLNELRDGLPRDFRPKGDVFVFVDECHRTQSSVLHDAMKALLPGAMFIGFTGTPLLKKDKKTSVQTFGPYIHTYKYREAVVDRTVVELVYEARDIDQSITSQDKVDQWFELKTRGMNDVARAQLKQRWGTMQRVLSSQDRLEKIVADILWDMETRDRLRSGHGNAILVSGSIYQACRLYEMFLRTDLAGKCAIVTSYRPAARDIKAEESGEGQTEKLEQYEIYRRMLAAHFDEPEDMAVSKVEQFEKDVKDRFIKQPGQMKLLIVVDKLLTGFDAPPATYLYIDKQMKDHGLFQAVCRVNRLDSDDKEYGYIIDYRNLFKSLEQSVHDYTGDAFDGFDAEDVAGLLTDRLVRARERLEEVRESVATLCEPVEPPRDTQAYLRYFCGTDNADAERLEDNEPRRLALYKLVAALVRAYSAIANEMEQATYSAEQVHEIKTEVAHYEKVREEVKLASGDYIDLKMYEPAMRHLLDTYIRAEESVKVSAFDDKTLLELIVERGAAALDALPEGVRQSREATAEVIENNVRKVIINEMAVNPRYYEKMSEVLDALIQARKQAAIDYKAYLAQVVELAKKVKGSEGYSSYPAAISTPARRALYDNLEQDEELAIRVDDAIRDIKKDGWRGHIAKEREVRYAIESVLAAQPGMAESEGPQESASDLGPRGRLPDAIFELAKNQRDY